MKLEADRNVDAKGKDVEKVLNEKDNEVFDIKNEATGHKEKISTVESAKGNKAEDGELNGGKVRKPDDKIVTDSGSIDVKDMHDEFMYMQVPSGTDKKDEMGKSTDISDIVNLLQAIFAILLVNGKTLHEQSLQIARLLQLSQPSLLSQLQPKASLSPPHRAPARPSPGCAVRLRPPS